MSYIATALLYLMGNTIILMTFAIIMVGAFYVLATECKWLLEVDLLWKVKQKARAWAYAEPKKRETLVRLLQVRKGRNKKSRIGFIPNKLRLQKREDNPQTKEVSNHQTTKKSR